jgi:hypothetical protein
MNSGSLAGQLPASPALGLVTNSTDNNDNNNNNINNGQQGGAALGGAIVGGFAATSTGSFISPVTAAAAAAAVAAAAASSPAPMDASMSQLEGSVASMAPQPAPSLPLPLVQAVLPQPGGVESKVVAPEVPKASEAKTPHNALLSHLGVESARHVRWAHAVNSQVRFEFFICAALFLFCAFHLLAYLALQQFSLVDIAPITPFLLFFKTNRNRSPRPWLTRTCTSSRLTCAKRQAQSPSCATRQRPAQTLVLQTL